MHSSGVSVSFGAVRADPGIVWHVNWFSLPCLLENIVQQWTFAISKYSEECCLTTEQILRLLWTKNCYSAEIEPKQHSGSKVFYLNAT